MKIRPFQRKKTLAPHSSKSPNFPSLTVIEARFNEAEDGRARAFEASRREREFEFLKAQAARCAPQLAREEQFEQFLEDVRTTFRNSDESRHRIFQEAEAKQVETSQAKERARDVIFETAQASREADFQASQARLANLAETYAQVRGDMFLQGRRAREEACERLVETICGEIEAILEVSEQEFNAGQSRRADVVLKLLQQKSIGGAQSKTSMLGADLPEDEPAEQERIRAPHSHGRSTLRTTLGTRRCGAQAKQSCSWRLTSIIDILSKDRDACSDFSSGQSDLSSYPRITVRVPSPLQHLSLVHGDNECEGLMSLPTPFSQAEGCGKDTTQVKGGPGVPGSYSSCKIPSLRRGKRNG
ncbi:unnamed protein product [Somion occarium]|uniref:Uncharacterized protein n=1 Tax=Somion occarium TaxID=3059160 RepID=A0ABP1DP83_9APHY